MKTIIAFEHHDYRRVKRFVDESTPAYAKAGIKLRIRKMRRTGNYFASWVALADIPNDK